MTVIFVTCRTECWNGNDELWIVGKEVVLANSRYYIRHCTGATEENHKKIKVNLSLHQQITKEGTLVVKLEAIQDFSS